MTLSYPEKYLPEQEWERRLRLKRELEAALADHEYQQMMKREPSPATSVDGGTNRHERRKQNAKARRRQAWD